MTPDLTGSPGSLFLGPNGCRRGSLDAGDAPEAAFTERLAADAKDGEGGRPDPRRDRLHQRGDHRLCVGDPAVCAAADVWRRLCRYTDARALVRLARGPDCDDWPVLYELAVELAGPLARSRRPEVRSFTSFDVLHDRIWAACRRCNRADCIRCYPLGDKHRNTPRDRAPEHCRRPDVASPSSR